MKKFNLDHICELVDLMDKMGLNELDIKDGEQAVHLKRNTAQSQGIPMMQMPVMTAPQQAGLGAIQTPAEGKKAEDGHVVAAPMVGTFYRSASPEAASFVEVGDKVKKGQTLCIIEAMKTMNHIEADKDGVVSKILVENASPVEFGEPLFVIG